VTLRVLTLVALLARFLIRRAIRVDGLRYEASAISCHGRHGLTWRIHLHATRSLRGLGGTAVSRSLRGIAVRQAVAPCAAVRDGGGRDARGPPGVAADRGGSQRRCNQPGAGWRDRPSQLAPADADRLAA
jgi:hypothetical protein